MAESFDPYYQWLGIPPRDQPPHHYRLLGLEPLEENVEVIEHAADQRMGFLRTFQSGRHAALSQKLLNEIAAAKLCLLNPQKKAAYDHSLRAKIAPPATPPRAEGALPDDKAFGEYVLLERLDESGGGRIYKAKHRTLRRVVALKMLAPELTDTPARVERFHRKVKILARLSHPNLVAAYDAGVRGGVHYLAMEYVDGQDLARLLKRHGPLPPGHAVSYVVQAAAGIGHAHRHGIYHRNVKPGNLMVTRQGVVKVIGLGLARIDLEALPEDMSMGPELTAPGEVMGTPDYMAPEQGLDSSRADHRADIYALGCTLFALLTGRPPYPEKSPIKKILAHRDHPIPSLYASRPDVPAALDAVFRKMLAKRPEDRQQSMDEVTAELGACHSAEPRRKTAPPWVESRRAGRL